MRFHKVRTFTVCTLLTVSATLSLGGCGGSGFLGLQDYQRDLLFSIGGGLAGALLSGGNQPGTDDGQSGLDAPGPPGEPGPQGPAGPPIFATFVDTFFSGVATDVLGLQPVRNNEPKLGEGAAAVAASVAIPTNYQGSNPINMRVVLFRSGPCNGGCFVFTVNARRAQLGDSAAGCFGGAAADCSDGTRYIRVEDSCADSAAAEDPNDIRKFLLVDLPLSDAGLAFPAVEPGDLLAFELGTFSSDGGTYDILGVEFSDASPDPAPSGADVFLTQEAIPACQPAE